MLARRPSGKESTQDAVDKTRRCRRDIAVENADAKSSKGKILLRVCRRFEVDGPCGSGSLFCRFRICREAKRCAKLTSPPIIILFRVHARHSLSSQVFECIFRPRETSAFKGRPPLSLAVAVICMICCCRSGIECAAERVP